MVSLDVLSTGDVVVTFEDRTGRIQSLVKQEVFLQKAEESKSKAKPFPKGMNPIQSNIQNP